MYNSGQLRVENPCPFVPTTFTKTEECNHFCKSCSKTIIDFRGKTDEEIKAVITKDTCGIFTSDQLPAQQKMALKRKPLFYLMTVLSALGFSVKPAVAQTVQNNPDSLKVNTQQKPPALTKAQQEEIKKKLIKAGILVATAPKDEKKEAEKVIKYRTIGCPSF